VNVPPVEKPVEPVLMLTIVLIVLKTENMLQIVSVQ
jgi:hypothetical protein